MLGEKNELKNRYCHIKYNEKVADAVTPKVTVNVTVKFTENQKKLQDLKVITRIGADKNGHWEITGGVAQHHQLKEPTI